MPIEDFFRPTEVPGNFPLLRLVVARKEEGYVPVFELYRPREVLRAAPPGKLPHVLEPEVGGELVDPPGPGGVRRVSESHSSPPSIRQRIDTVVYR